MFSDNFLICKTTNNISMIRKKKRIFMADMGIEPTTFALLARRSNQLS